jgi:hypothetical protein
MTLSHQRHPASSAPRDTLSCCLQNLNLHRALVIATDLEGFEGAAQSNGGQHWHVDR